MRKMNGLERLSALAFVALLTEAQARAYTDPGSGALIWQSLVAAFVGGSFYFRRFITRFFQKKNRD